VLLAAAGHAQTGKDLAAPERLTADGKAIDHGQYIGHTGPLLADYDGDGLTDLLVGSFRGHVELFKNTGTRTAPKFTSQGLLEAAGAPLKIHNW
jgi:hypothetical protein